MIDRPAPEPPYADHVAPADPPEENVRARRRGPHLGPLPITLAVIVVTLAFVGSLVFLAWVVLGVDEDQIPLLATGFAVLGASIAAIAIGALVGMWRAASRAEGGRALVLAIVGGIAAMAAIGCFTVTALAAMVWNT